MAAVNTKQGCDSFTTEAKCLTISKAVEAYASGQQSLQSPALLGE